MFAQVQAGIYTGPFVLKKLIEKSESLSTCMVDQLQQPMTMGQKMNYTHGMKNLLSHNLNATPISCGILPLVTNAWPTSMSGSFGIDQNSSYPEFGSLPQSAKINKYHGPNLNEVQWRASNTPPQVYQHSEEWMDKDIFAIANAPRRQSSPLDISRIIPSCIYSSMRLEQPLMNLYPFGRERYQNMYQTIEKQYEQIEVNRNIKQSNNNNFQGQVWHFLIYTNLNFL